MSATTTIHVGAEHGVQTAGTGKRRRLRWRHLWIVPGLAVAVLANRLGNEHGVSILALIAFGIGPDLPRLLGLGRRPVDSIPVRAFNVLHDPVSSVAAVALTIAGVETGVVPVIWLVGSLVWLGHVVIGLGVGDVRRTGGDRSYA
jgi:hypothetical protein